LSRSSTLSKNRSNSGVRNTTYLKSHQFLRTKNHAGLQSFHSNAPKMESSDRNQKFGQNNKLTINQVKAVNNIEEGKSIITIEKSSNNFTSYHTSKQPSLRANAVTREFYVGVNSSNNMNNYSSITNSSAKHGDTSESKERFIKNSKQKLRQFSTHEAAENMSGICANNTMDERLRDIDMNDRQKSVERKAVGSKEILHDVEMEIED